MTETAKMYGGSLYDLAAEEGIEQQLLEEIETVSSMLKEIPEYLHLLSLPNLPKKERCALIDEAFGGSVHPYVLNFMKILCENGTLRELSGCSRAFRERYNRAHGIAEATAVSAVPLTREQTARLSSRLTEITGKKVDLTVKVDPSVLGGIRLDMEGVQLDGTVRSRLAVLRARIAQAAF